MVEMVKYRVPVQHCLLSYSYSAQSLRVLSYYLVYSQHFGLKLSLTQRKIVTDFYQLDCGKFVTTGTRVLLGRLPIVIALTSKVKSK